MSADTRALLRSRAIAVLWALGGLAPVVTLIWAAAAGGSLPPLPDGVYFGPLELGPPLVLVTLQFVPLAFVGAALVSRPAAPPIGWAMLAVAACGGAAGLLDRYAVSALVLDPGSLPAGEAVAVVANVLPRVSHVLLGTVVLLLVPTGWLAAGLPRTTLRIGVLVGAVLVLRTLLAEGPLRSFALLENPLAVEGLDPDALAFILPDLAFHACVAAAAFVVWRAAAEAARPEHRSLLRRAAVLAVVVSFSGGLLVRIGSEELLAVPAAMLLLLLVNVTVFSARYHGLWAMPALLHRSVAWLIGTTVLLVAYGALVGGAVAGSGELSGAQRLVAIAAATLVATPAALLTARAFERRLLGDSADPRTALLRLLRTLDAAPVPALAPQALADAAARAVRHGRVTVELHGTADPVAAAGPPPRGPATRTALPIVHAGTALGVLAVRVPDDEPLAPAEQRTLAAMASFSAAAVSAARLAVALEDGRLRRSEVVASEREAVADVLRLEFTRELDAMAQELPRIDHLDDEARAEAVERFYVSCGEMVERVRQVSRALGAADAPALEPVPG